MVADPALDVGIKASKEQTMDKLVNFSNAMAMVVAAGYFAQQSTPQFAAFLVACGVGWFIVAGSDRLEMVAE